MDFESGLPRINGAFVDGKKNYDDSAHLAGILALLDHPQQVDCREYIVDRVVDRDTASAKYIRHPLANSYDFSRDQFILLAAGLWKQRAPECVNIDWIDGKDIIPPSVHGMVRKIKGREPYFWQRWNFEAEFQTNVTIQKLEEPFQVIAMCMVYGDGYLNRWTRENNLWKWAIKRYLCELDGTWRGEPELADFCISQVEKEAAK